MAATDRAIDGTLLDATGQPLDLSNATLTWTLIGRRACRSCRTVTLDASAGLIRVANAKTAQLERGRYIDALQLTIGDIVSLLWTGVILVAANPRRAVPPP